MDVHLNVLVDLVNEHVAVRDAVELVSQIVDHVCAYAIELRGGKR